MKKIATIFFILLITECECDYYESDYLGSKLPQCSRLSNGCKLKTFISAFSRPLPTNSYICHNLNFKFKPDELVALRNCTFYQLLIYFRLGKAAILDDSLDIGSVVTFLDTSSQNNAVAFNNLKGFAIDAFKYTDFFATLVFYDSRFEFYSNGIRIDSCDQLNLNRSNMSSIFQVLSKHSSFVFKKCTFKHRVCPLVFTNFTASGLTIENFIDTIYKRNILTFTNISDSITEINSMIVELRMDNFEIRQLDSRLLNRLAFKNINCLYLYGKLNSILTGLFRSFTQLRRIVLYDSIIRQFFHNGIDWMFDLNFDLNIDVRNATQMKKVFQMRFIRITFTHVIQVGRKFSDDTITSLNLFPNEDFCLYTRFPFNQLIVLFFDNQYEDRTCTYIWIVQYYSNYNESVDISTFDSTLYWIINRDLKANLSDLIKKCDFQEM